jgi:drug/metabolite transporter (DMT)-like permease
MNLSANDHRIPSQYVLIGSMAGNWFKRAKSKTAPLAGLLLLSALWSFRSLQIDLIPGADAGPLPPLEREALPFVILAVAAASIAALRRAKWPEGRQFARAAWVGLGLFLVPSLLVQLANRWVTDLTRVALFALVPIFAVVFAPYIGVSQPEPRGALQAALAALGGMLCIFPVNLPDSIESGIAFCVVIVAAACAAAANCLAVGVASESGEESIAPFAAIAAATAALGFAVSSTLTERMVWRLDAVTAELFLSAALGLVELLLLFWLMRRLSAVRMTTRYLFAPLIAAVFGLLYLRAPLSLRTGLGLLLLFAGAGWLLLAPHEEAESVSLTANSG